MVTVGAQENIWLHRCSGGLAPTFWEDALADLQGHVQICCWVGAVGMEGGLLARSTYQSCLLQCLVVEPACPGFAEGCQPCHTQSSSHHVCLVCAMCLSFHETPGVVLSRKIEEVQVFALY